MAGKELDTNFFIFLPQVQTNDPVFDIESGSRKSCFAGEHLYFFLIAQFRGKSKEDGKFRAWQKRLLRLCTYVRVKPKITSRGDIIYPLNVVLNSLPALTRRMRLSVNVWTPELDAFPEESLNKEELRRYLTDYDPEEESDNAWRCIVNATLPVVTPPTLRCRYFQVAGKHFLCIEVINILGKSVNLNQVDVYATCDTASENLKNMIQNQFYLKQPIKSRFSGLDVFPVVSSDDLSTENPILLKPWEHYAFLFRIIHHESQMASQKLLEVPLKGSLTWEVETLKGRNEVINTTYSLPVFVLRRSSVSVRASCQSSVNKGKRFQVKYTVTNTEEDDAFVSLVWSPSSYGSTSVLGIFSLEQSLVCLQPNVRIGCCPAGSSLTVCIEFLAIQEGLHEVGKYMKCKWHSEMNDRNFPGSPSQGQNAFTTISYSCQVYVTCIR
ncbi:trafficking protein particle complex subunit 14-like isoform X2 [Montipora foliosa]|uniref:trafficking protein particle complex subunit 14-like isoform X2 n=1 Tax=Montipora foliosa TaxID=591990 RepID=UPI0035F13474